MNKGCIVIFLLLTMILLTACLYAENDSLVASIEKEETQETHHTSLPAQNVLPAVRTFVFRDVLTFQCSQGWSILDQQEERIYLFSNEETYETIDFHIGYYLEEAQNFTEGEYLQELEKGKGKLKARLTDHMRNVKIITNQIIEFREKQVFCLEYTGESLWTDDGGWREGYHLLYRFKYKGEEVLISVSNDGQEMSTSAKAVLSSVVFI